MNYIVFICWVIILHHSALLQSSSSADDFLANKHVDSKSCVDLCRELNLRKRSPTSSMLENIVPLKMEDLRRFNRDVLVMPGYNFNSLQDAVMDFVDFLCDCDAFSLQI